MNKLTILIIIVIIISIISIISVIFYNKNIQATIPTSIIARRSRNNKNTAEFIDRDIDEVDYSNDLDIEEPDRLNAKDQADKDKAKSNKAKDEADKKRKTANDAKDDAKKKRSKSNETNKNPKASTAEKKAANAAADDAEKATSKLNKAATKAENNASKAASKASASATRAASIPKGGTTGFIKDAEFIAQKAKAAALNKGKIVIKSASELIDNAAKQLKLSGKSMGIYSTVRDPNQAFGNTSKKVIGKELQKACERLSGLVRDAAGKLGMAPAKIAGEIDTMVVKKVMQKSAKTLARQKKLSIAKKNLSKVGGQLLQCIGPAIMMYEIADYSKTHSRTETVVYVCEQSLQSYAIEIGLKYANKAYKVTKVAVKAAQAGQKVGQAVSREIARQIEKEVAKAAARRAAQQAAQRAAQQVAERIAIKLAMRGAQQVAVTGGVSLFGSIMQGINSTLAVAAGPVGVAIALVIDVAVMLGMLIYMIVEYVEGQKAQMKAKRISSAAESMDIASAQSLSNTLLYLYTRNISMPDSTEDSGFIYTYYVGVYDSDEKNTTYDTYLMTFWSDLDVSIQIQVVNNDNDLGLYTFSPEVREVIRDYFIENQFFYYNELTSGSVTHNPVTKGYVEEPEIIKTPSVKDYYQDIFTGGATVMFKFMCNTTTESWTCIKCVPFDINKSYQFPTTGTPISQIPPIPAKIKTDTHPAQPAQPAPPGYYFSNQLDAINLMGPLNTFYTEYGNINNISNNSLINPYILVQYARQLITIPNADDFDYTNIDNNVLQIFINFCNNTTMFLNNIGLNTNNFFITESINNGTNSTLIVKNHIFSNIDIQINLFQPLQQFYYNMVNDYRIMNNHYDLSIDTLDNYAYMFYLLQLNLDQSGNSIPATYIDTNNGMLLNISGVVYLRTIMENYFNNNFTQTTFPSGDTFNSNKNFSPLKTDAWNNVNTFSLVKKYFAGIFYNMLWTDVGCAMNVFGYFYKTSSYYTTLASSYVSFYADRWVAIANNMIPTTISANSIILPDYFVSNFTSFNLNRIQDPCIIGTDGDITSVDGLHFDGSVSIETLASYVDNILNCIGFSVDNTFQRNITFYSVASASTVRLEPSQLYIYSFYKISSCVNKGLPFINFLNNFLQNVVSIGNIVNTYDPGMVTVLNNYEQRINMQVVGDLIGQSTLTQSINTSLEITSQGNIPQSRINIYYLLQKPYYPGAIIVYNKFNFNISYYTPGTSFIVPADTKNSNIVIFNPYPNKANYLTSDPNYEYTIYTTKYNALIPDQTLRISNSNFKNPQNYTLTRTPNTPFSNKEIAENIYLCNNTPYCRGFDIDPSLSTFALYFANQLVSKITPNQTNYFYTMAGEQAYPQLNTGLTCSNGNITALNPNKCLTNINYNLIRINDGSFLVINKDNWTVYTMTSNTSRAIPTTLTNIISIYQCVDNTFVGCLTDGSIFTQSTLNSYKTFGNGKVSNAIQIIQDKNTKLFYIINKANNFLYKSINPLVNYTQINSYTYSFISQLNDFTWFVQNNYTIYHLINIYDGLINPLWENTISAIQLADNTFLILRQDNLLYTTPIMRGNIEVLIAP